MRTTCSTGEMNILPSPTLPVRAAAVMTSTMASTRSSGTTISNFTLGTMFSSTSVPRKYSVQPCWLPQPLTWLTVMPPTSAANSASFSGSSFSGRTMAIILFISRSFPSV